MASKRALVADDDEFFRLALASLLIRHCQFTDVVETSSLDEALARLGEQDGDQRFDLALFDLEMPGMAGSQSLAAVRECFPEVRTVVVTASTKRHDVLRALEAGTHGFIPKGHGVKDLAKAIELVMSGLIFVPAWMSDISNLDLPTPRDKGDAVSATILPGEALTTRQSQVLGLIVKGNSNKEIARAMALAEGTVKVHVAALLRAFRVASRAGLAALGTRLSLEQERNASAHAATVNGK